MKQLQRSNKRGGNRKREREIKRERERGAANSINS